MNALSQTVRVEGCLVLAVNNSSQELPWQMVPTIHCIVPPLQDFAGLRLGLLQHRIASDQSSMLCRQA